MRETQCDCVCPVKAVENITDSKVQIEAWDMTVEEIRAAGGGMTEVQREYVMAVTSQEREKELRERVMDERRIAQLITLLLQLQNWGTLPVSL